MDHGGWQWIIVDLTRHHRLDGREFEWTPGVGDGLGSLACCNSWGRKELDTTERLKWTELNWTRSRLRLSCIPDVLCMNKVIHSLAPDVEKFIWQVLSSQCLLVKTTRSSLAIWAMRPRSSVVFKLSVVDRYGNLELLEVPTGES